MSLMLDHVSKDVGTETHIRDVSLTLQAGEIRVVQHLLDPGEMLLPERNETEHAAIVRLASSL